MGSSRGDELAAEAAATEDTGTTTVPQSGGSPELTPSAAPTLSTPADAIRQAEMARIRFFIPVILAFAVVVVVAMPFIGGSAVAKSVLLAGIVAAGGAAVYMYRLAGDPALYTEGRVGVVVVICGIGVCCAVYYFGIFSPAPAVAVVGLFFVGIGRAVRVSLLLYAITATAHASVAVLIINGSIPDHGLLKGDYIGRREQIVVQVLLGLTMLITYAISIASKRQSEKSIVELDRAVRAIAHREALLLEARQELDRARHVGGPGRFSEQTIGSFRLGVVIGRGAAGEVYDAVHVETGAPAAVKLLSPGHASDPRRLERFVREARIVATLRSPHVVRLLEVGDSNAPLPYLAMERMVGYDLAHQLRREPRLSIDRVVELVSHIADGLEEARAAGIVHRDLKPQNVFLHRGENGEPTWKILDFGVSKLEDHHGTLTQGHVVGTPMYMAPEQARGGDVDHRADVYALATVAYRALTGHPPFPRKDVPSILYSVIHDMPARPRELGDVPRDVERVLAIGMSKDPSDRFETARELAAALRAAAGGDLEGALRRRADALVAARPWGRC